jgi:hypothetical protein
MTKHISFSSYSVLALAIATLYTVSSCKKSSSGPSTPAGATIIQSTINVQSIIGTSNDDDVDPTRTGFIDLYDGAAYTQSDAAAKSSEIDFAYNYHGGGCNTCRFFENVQSMSTRTDYVSSFSTITATELTNAAYYYNITEGQFDSIQTAANIDTLFAKYNITNLGEFSDITNRVNDVAIGKVFAFTDKNGKKGFFEINDYIANVPDGDPAPLTLTVKIEK